MSPAILNEREREREMKENVELVIDIEGSVVSENGSEKNGESGEKGEKGEKEKEGGKGDSGELPWAERLKR